MSKHRSSWEDISVLKLQATPVSFPSSLVRNVMHRAQGTNSCCGTHQKQTLSLSSGLNHLVCTRANKIFLTRNFLVSTTGILTQPETENRPTEIVRRHGSPDWVFRKFTNGDQGEKFMNLTVHSKTAA